MAILTAPRPPVSRPVLPPYSARAPGSPARALGWLWRHSIAASAATIGISAVAAAAIGVSMPRFPATAAEAVFVLTVGVALGCLAGVAMRSRWAMLLVPTAAVLGFHVGRVV